jgi:YesN/AraC family two-component response regulator
MTEQINVMILDGEDPNKSPIKMQVDWEKCGFCIAAEAATVEEACNLADAVNPDIIFTDICMPKTDGIDFASQILKRHPSVKIVIVTTHGDLEYAQKCIRIGVSDFIRKPVKVEELLSVSSRLKAKILEERRSAMEHEKMRKELELLGFDREISTSKQGDVISKVKIYLEENMSDSKLSLAETASAFFISPGHLGRLMKHKTGETFVEYLTGIRIQTARRLLRTTDLKGYEVAERVGIHDPHYFSILFKKLTGVSISEFRSM